MGFLDHLRIDHSKTPTDAERKKLDEALERAFAYGKKHEPHRKTRIPKNLFYEIYGHDDIKNIFRKILHAKKPIHPLLIGPPATAKSLFLEAIASLPEAVMVAGGTSTGEGIRDLIFDQLPRYIVVDELDKIRTVKDLTTLLTIAERGYLSSTKAGEHKEIQRAMWIFAGANRIREIESKRSELISRMWKIHIPPYDREMALKVMIHVLISREKTSEIMASKIAYSVVDLLDSRDPRDAVRIARIAQSERDVDWAIEMIQKYGDLNA